MPLKPKGAQKRRDSSDSRESGESGESESPKPAEKPVSLHPLEFEEAVKGLLKVKPGKERSNAKCK